MAATQPTGTISAAEAARLLGVKPQTLYAYVSRGLLRSSSAPHGRARLYAADDVRRLKARSDARRGHTAVAAAALDWGAPVLDSAITRIDPELGPHYRGRAAVALARKAASFESVCEWLWSGSDAAPPPAPLPAALQHALARCADDVPHGAAPLAVLSLLLSLCAVHDLDRHARSAEAEWDRARALLRAMAAGLALGRHARARAIEPRRGERLAALACRALGAAPSPERARAIDQALVLSADHELNVSTFAVRVTASSGADLYACLGAGLCALSGPWHGGMCDRVEALARACERPSRARAVLRERARLGDYVPGFGQPLYPAGDPRGEFLCRRAWRLAPHAPRVAVLRAIAGCMRDDKQPPPTVDFGLCAISAALGLREGAASALFALGRGAGWIAHALEQRAQKKLLRPRARYVGADAGAHAQSTIAE
jgi:citrate synthase